MRSLFNMIYFAGLIAFPSAARAQEADDAKTRSSYFLGAWDCTGMVFAPQSDHVSHVEGTWRFHRWPSGWVTDAFETYSGKGTSFAEWGWTRYEHSEQAYVRHSANTLGGYGQYQTQGWEDATWTWSGEVQALSPNAAPAVQTITKKSDDHFWISVRYFDGHGKRRDLYKADCRRQGAERGLDTQAIE